MAMRGNIMMTKPCMNCNEQIIKQPSRSVKDFLTRTKYCSKKCQYPPKITKSCLECKSLFTVKNYRKDTANFCSHNCSALFRDEGKRTADKKIRQSAIYKKWRIAVFERDGYRCTNCGDSNYEGRGETCVLQADHIKPFALFPELRFNIKNGRTLCVPCHKNTGTFGRGAIYRKRCMAAG